MKLFIRVLNKNAFIEMHKNNSVPHKNVLNSTKKNIYTKLILYYIGSDLILSLIIPY